MIRLPLAAFVLLALAATPARAQLAADGTLEPGRRVRVTSAAGDRIVGTALAHTADALVLRRDGSADTVRVALASLRRLEWGERRRRVGKGALIGLALGAGIGAAAGAAQYEEEEVCTLFCTSRGGEALAGGLVLGVVGAAAGAVVGAFPKDRWHDVPLVRRASLRVAPSLVARRVALSASLALPLSARR